MIAPPLRLYLVRHGQTEWSLSGRHTGRTDIALTAHGEDEASALVPWLRHVTFARIFTSPLQRARRTCERALPGQAAEIAPDLAEWNYGEYEGISTADIRSRRPDWNVFRDGCPGGETPADIALRADRLIAHLRTLTGNIALFSHGQFGPALAARWIGVAVVEGEHLQIDTASLNILGYHPTHPDTPVIALWNATPSWFAAGA